MSIHKRKMAIGLVTAFAAAALIAPLLTIGASGAATNQAKQVAPRVSITSLPRNETLYTSGTMYSAPTIWNPMDTGNYATGTEGLLYETLFLYNPVANTFIPWLARSGTWTSPSTYKIVLRNDVTWSNGKSLTCSDVAYTIMLAKTNPAVPYSNLGQFLSGVACPNASTAVVTFSTPAYTQWQSFLWQDPIINQSVWSKLSPANQVTGANAHPIGSGAMLLYAANDQEVVYTDNPNWWATKDLGLKLHFKYLVDIVNAANPVELGQLLEGNIDWSNNFLAGISSLVSSPASTGVLNGTGGDGLLTYYPNAPYMLSANTVWLEPNTTKFPMSNLNFRKALAYAINPSQITSVIYDSIVDPANPVGLLPNLDPYIPASVKPLEFGYNPAKAKAFLAASGYKGTPVTIQDPDGWTDWNSATDLIVNELKAVGINAVAYFPQQAARNTNLTDGTYDLALDNNAQVDSTPWSYFNRVFALPILKQQSAQLNWERFSDPAAWALVQKIGTIVPTDTAAIQAVYTQLEKIFLPNLPEIPLWYNGMWAQFNTATWHDYPTSTNPNDQYTPVMWRGYLGNMTTILALAQIEPTATK
ncbi:MAG: ABC transporter substrate-binding protein [Acidimicrobiales bacterium]